MFRKTRNNQIMNLEKRETYQRIGFSLLRCKTLEQCITNLEQHLKQERTRTLISLRRLSQQNHSQSLTCERVRSVDL